MIDITVDVESQRHEGDFRHFDEICRELGITYERAKGVAIAGKVYLHNCKVPDGVELPKHWVYGIDGFILKKYFCGS